MCAGMKNMGPFVEGFIYGLILCIVGSAICYFMLGCATGPKTPDIRESKPVLKLNSDEPTSVPVKRVNR